MTADEWVRFVILPALGTAALFAIVMTLRQTWREWIDGEW